jgi:hypothetical protein
MVRDEKVLDQQETALGILIYIEGGYITLLTPCLLFLSDMGLATTVSGVLVLPWRAACTGRNLMAHSWGLRCPGVARRQAYCRCSCGALCWWFNRSGVNTQGHIDDIFLLTVVRFPDTVLGLMQRARHTVEVGCGERSVCRLIPTKLNLLYLQVKDTSEPVFFGINSHRSLSVTYLGIVLDSRLTWR